MGATHSAGMTDTHLRGPETGRFPAGSLPSLLRPHMWIRVGIGVYGLGNEYGRFLARQV